MRIPFSMIQNQTVKQILNGSLPLHKLMPIFKRNPSILYPFSTASSACLIQPTAITMSVNSSYCSHKCSSTRLVLVLETLATLPNKAYSLFKRTQNYGCKHSIPTYFAIIHILGHSNMHYLLVCILSDVISANGDLGFEVSSLVEFLSQGRRGLKWVSVVSDALVKAYVFSNKADEAIDVFCELCSLGFTPSMKGCNFLLNFVVENCDLGKVTAVYNMMKGFGICPDAYMHTILIKAFCRGKKFDQALEVVETMNETGVKPDLITYSTILSYHTPENGIRFLTNRKEDGIHVDVVACNTVISGLCKEQKLEEAEEVLGNMWKFGLEPDAYSYGLLIKCYCEKRNVFRAVDLHNEMELNDIETNHIILSFLIQLLSNLEMNSKALEHFHKFKASGHYIDKVLYSIAINVYCKMGNMREAVDLFEEMKSQNLVPDKKHFTTLISGFCNLGKIYNACKVFEEMLGNNVEPDLMTYNILIRGFCRNGFFKAASTFVDSMHLDPNVVTCSLLIEGMCREGDVRGAQIFFRQLEERGIQQSIHVYCAMISGYLMSGLTKEAYTLFYRLSKGGSFEESKLHDEGDVGRAFEVFKSTSSGLITELSKEGNVERASWVFKSMLKIGITPGVISYNQIIAGYCHIKDIEKARAYFEDFIDRRLTPDVILYTTLINGYWKVHRKQEAGKLFNEMVRKGIKPDVIACTVMLDGYLKDLLHKDRKGFYNESNKIKFEAKYVTSLGDFENLKIEADLVWYTVLVDGFSKVGYLEEAEEHFNEMIKRGLVPDSFPYTALIHGYCVRGDVAKASVLFDEMLDKGVHPDLYTYIALGKLQILTAAP